MNKIKERDIEKNIKITVASMNFEGLYPTEDEIELLRKIGRGETTAEIEIRRIINELTVK